jgi:hypothetical protein
MYAYKQNYHLVNIAEYNHMEETHDKVDEHPGDYSCTAFVLSERERERVTPRKPHKYILSLRRIQNGEPHRLPTDLGTKL